VEGAIGHAEVTRMLMRVRELRAAANALAQKGKETRLLDQRFQVLLEARPRRGIRHSTVQSAFLGNRGGGVQVLRQVVLKRDRKFVV
jgi:hypothetical protein